MDRSKVQQSSQSRRGIVMIVSVFLLIVVFAFVSFTVDIGYITLTRAEMQNAADAGAFVAAGEVRFGLEDPTRLLSSIETDARTEAANIVALHRNGNHTATTINQNNDIEFGQAVWNTATNSWTKTWGVAPYNVAKVTLNRSQNTGTELPLFISPMFGVDSTNLTVSATAATFPAEGFWLESGSSGHIPILPFSVDIDRWSLCLAGSGTDHYKFVENPDRVVSSGEGIAEINIFPMRDGSLPAGNSGTVNLGAPNNSTADISRQIVEGLNAYDLSFFGGEISTANGPLTVTGDPGISAGFKDELRSIIGQTRAIPVFDHVNGQGVNTTYRVVKFVGCRVMAVKLTGPLTKKHLIVQPARIPNIHAVRNIEYVFNPDSILAPPVLID